MQRHSSLNELLRHDITAQSYFTNLPQKQKQKLIKADSKIHNIIDMQNVLSDRK